MTRHGHAAAAAILAVAVLLAAGCSSQATGTTPSESHPRSNALGLGGFTRERGPFIFGQKVSLEEAEGQVPFHLYRPDDSLASDRSIRAVFVENTVDDEGNPVVRAAIDYQTGVLLTLAMAPSTVVADPLAFWTTKTSQNDGRSVATVLGGPALVIQRNVNEAGNPAAVSMVIDGVLVTLYGQYGPIEATALIDAADTIS
jgi:hypothetical protein